MRISVCTIVAGRHDHLRRQLRGLERQDRRPDEVVLVSMDDPAIPAIAAASPLDPLVRVIRRHPNGSMPLAVGRNRAARNAGGDLLIFLDVDCIPSRRLVARYAEVATEDGLWCGEVRYLPPDDRATHDDELFAAAEPHPARPEIPRTTVHRCDDHALFWSLNFAVPKTTWETLGGFDEGFTGYGGEDTDLGYTARDRGVPMWWVGGAEAFHQHHPKDDPPLGHVEDIVRNARYFHDKWGSWPMRDWLDAFAERGLVRWTADGPVALGEAYVGGGS